MDSPKFAVKREEKFVVVDEATGKPQVYTRIEDVPPDVREKIEKARQAAKDSTGSSQDTSTRSFTYRDATGCEHTYHSLDEMPPEVRQIFENIRTE
ncbi:MAG: hypothetical protein V2A74_05270 [bacterium]